jgi:uncharacterized protein YkwD
LEAYRVKGTAALAVATALMGLLLASAAGAVPGWYWQWAKWRLGHDSYRCHAGERGLRPDVPKDVPAWAWDRLDRHAGGQCVKSGAAPSSAPSANPAPAPPPQAPAAVALDPAEAALRDAVNAARQANGLADLAIEPRLQRAARERSADMVAHGYFAHEWHDGTSFDTWITRYWPCSGAGEILVRRTPSLNAEQAVQLWLASPSHRANMLSPDWRNMGVELGGIYGTVDFGGLC